MADFDQLYWAHQPPEVRGLPGIVDQNQRGNRAIELAMKGFSIDVPIMVWGWDALNVMQMRQSYGYTWVPSALMPPVTAAPGIRSPVTIPYDPNNPPPGAIKVSTDPTDYPPFDPPAPPGPIADAVGGPILGMPNMFYALAPASAWPDGAIASNSRGTFRLHHVRGPMGDSAWFEQIR